jgi:hypothetical protein
VLGKDDETPPVDARYQQLVERLYKKRKGICSTSWEFAEDAQAIRRELERKHLELMLSYGLNRKLATHIGKYNGIYARLCLLFHLIENKGHSEISANTAQRAADFLHGFLLPHALSFYVELLGLSDDHDRLSSVAGYILAHKLERITTRDIQRGDRTMRRLDRKDTDSVFDHLSALGWLAKRTEKGWTVNPEVHHMFKERATMESERRKREREAIIVGPSVTQRRAEKRKARRTRI